MKTTEVSFVDKKTFYLFRTHLICCSGNLQIKSLSVRCSNKQHGCTWVGEFRALHQHTTDKCHYREVECPLGCNDSIWCTKLDNHTREECVNRNYECPDCKTMGKYCQMAGEHRQECLLLLEKCPRKGCDVEICSALVYFHQQTDCKFTIFDCKYKDVGCKVKLTRSDMSQHEKDDGAHLQLAMTTLQKQKKYFKLIGPTLSAINGTLYPAVFKIPNFKFRKTKSMKLLFLEHSAPYKFEVQFEFDKCISICFYIKQGPYDDILEWPFSETITIELLNQQEDSDHYKDSFSLPSDLGKKPTSLPARIDGYGSPQFITYKMLREKASQYIQDDTLYFRITIATTKYKSWLLSRPTMSGYPQYI